MRRPDVSKIRDLRADDVADRLNLLDPDGAPDGRSTRWRFRGYDGSFWVELHADGKWTDHKHGDGGDAISLVQAFLDGAPNFSVAEAQFLPACEMIASAYGLWETIADTRAHSQRLAAGEAQMGRLVEQWAAGRLESDNWRECIKLLEALDIERLTLCPDFAGTGALCWQPGVPWQGVAVSTKDGGRWGGWTRERALGFADHPDALSLIALDFDGSKPSDEGGPLKPSVALLERLVRELGKRGLPPAAVVWSSVDERDERTKAHLYWRAQRRAADESEWKRWWEACASACAEIVEGFNAPKAEAAALAHDPATQQITRLMRLPGFAKTGATVAPIVAGAAGGTVDIPGYLQTRDVQVSGAGLGEVTLGRCCKRVYTKGSGDNEQTVTKILAYDLWPVAIYEDEAGAVGVQVRYLDRWGRTRWALIEADSWVSKQATASATKQLGRDGAKLGVGVEHDLIFALGLWAQAPGRPRVKAVRAAGWHDECRAYLYGDVVLGTTGIVPAGGVPQRKARGTLDRWQAEAADLLDTPGMLTALAVSLAGPLVQPLARDNFAVHIHGPSSTGKSSVLEVAASVWGQGVETFNSTPKALEQRALAYSGACYPLDELAQSELREDQLGALIYNLISGQERGRLTKDAELRSQASWSLTLLFTGEHSINVTLGDAAMGGHLVRCLDVEVVPGETARDAAHSQRLKLLASRHHGVLGRAWIEHLLRVDWHMMAQRHAECAAQLREGVASPEVGRALDHIALAGLALREATAAGLLPWLDDAKLTAWLGWLRERVVSTRVDTSCPEARAWVRLLRDIELNPGMYPADDANVAPLKMAGVVDGDLLYATRSMLEAGCLASGCDVKRFISWLEAEGRTDGQAVKRRHLGRQLRWLTIRLESGATGQQARWL